MLPANGGARDGEEEDRPLRGTNSKKKRTVVRAGGADHTELEYVPIENHHGRYRVRTRGWPP